MKNEKGFTLTEVIVVLLLMAVLCAMVAPSLMQSWHQVVLDSTAQQLHRDLRWAQRMAVKEQRRVTVKFFRDKKPYRYTINCAGQVAVAKRRELPNNLERMEAQTVIIESDGMISKNGHILLQKGEIKRYVYYYNTGRTRVTKKETLG